MKVQRGLKELHLCEKLEVALDFRKPDYELLDAIREEAAKMNLPKSERFTTSILVRLKKRHYAGLVH